MKLFALAAAGLVAITGIAATPAEAQYRGNGYYQQDRGWHDGRQDRRWDRDRNWRGDRGLRGDRGWRGNRGWRDRSRVVCRRDRGYYGPVKRCFRMYR